MITNSTFVITNSSFAIANSSFVIANSTTATSYVGEFVITKDEFATIYPQDEQEHDQQQHRGAG